MGKNRWLGLLVGLMVVLGLVIGYLGWQIRTVKQGQVLKPVFSRQFATVAGRIRWEFRNFQPIIKSFKQEDGRNLVKVEWPDLAGDKRTATLVLGKTVNLTGFKKGEQVRAEYINAVPGNLNLNDCNSVAENFLELCQLTRILADQPFKATVQEQLQKQDYAEIIVPVVSLSKELYEN
ncbi:MAG: hypothetical protein ACOYY3_09030 [Chloroflexota bacterium]